jgi:hypothetical protein
VRRRQALAQRLRGDQLSIRPAGTLAIRAPSSVTRKTVTAYVVVAAKPCRDHLRVGYGIRNHRKR